MDDGPFTAFTQLLCATAEADSGAKPVHAAFDGNSRWLKRCREAAGKVPGVQLDGSPDVVITDSPTGDGWFFALNGQRLSPDLREFFWHANSGARPIDLSLHSEDGVEGSFRIPPVPSLYWREQHAAAMEAAPALVVVALLRRLGHVTRPCEPPVKVLPAAAAPGAVALNWFRFKKLSRSLYLCLPGANPETRWSVALHAHGADSIPHSGWKWTTGFSGHEAADPFLVSRHGRLWLFYEDMLPKTRHGRLAVMPAFDGSGEPTVILEKQYHLSYPCVFEHGGDWWMIPESADNRTVDLYRARRFPDQWEHSKTLIEGPRLKDTTPLFHEGRWYFFTTAVLPGRALAALLFTSEVLDGEWRLHPASPLTGDAGIARSAGAITRWKGRLIRPVQDCLVRYGYSIGLREIVRLSPSVWEEAPFEEIAPSWSPGIYATHTFCPVGGALALDARRR
ncbi:MAG TPA: hypothetical protein VH639_25400 [Bryobacteraceae bacterium]|jgi:hypothetical protein